MPGIVKGKRVPLKKASEYVVPEELQVKLNAARGKRREKAVELKRETVAGQERMVWNPALSTPAKDFEFSDPEVARIRAAIQTWDSYGANADRRWLQPLIEALFPPDIANA